MAQAVVLVALVKALMDQAVVLEAQEEALVVWVGLVIQAVLEKVDLALASTWEKILEVVERMEDSKATCPLYLMGIASRVTNSCAKSTS